MNKVIRSLLLGMVLLVPGRTLAAQEAEPPTEIVAPGVQEQVDGEAAGFPVRDTAPRLQRAYLHVFLAFGIAWLMILGYGVTLGRRFNRLEEDLERYTRSR